MNRLLLLGVTLGMLGAGSLATAQSTAQNSSGHKAKKVSRIKSKSSVKKQTLVKPKATTPTTPTALAQTSSKLVVGAPRARLSLKPLYAENSYGQSSATDSNPAGGPASGEKLLINPPLLNPSTTTSMPVSQAQPSEKKSAFSFKYRSYNAENLDALEMPNDPSKDHEVQAWDRFNFTYAVNDTVSVSVMPQVYHTWFGDRDRAQNPSVVGLTQPYDFYLGDTGLYLIDSKIADLGGGFKLDGSFAYFFSTSEASIANGTIGQTRSTLAAGRSYGPIDVKWTESFWYYLQEYQTSSLFSTATGPLQNSNYAILSLLDLGWNITKKFSINLETGFWNQASLPDDNTNRSPVLNDYIIADPEIDYSFSDHFSVGLGIWEQYDMRNQAVTVTAAAPPGSASSTVPVSWLPEYSPFDYRNGSQAYLQTTLKF